MTDATSKTVPTPPGEPPEDVDISGTDEAEAFEAEWNKNSPSLSELRTRRKQSIKREAREILRESDWFVIRHQEQAMRGRSQQGLPSVVADHRDEVRALEGDASDRIDAADSKDAVRSVTVDWPDPPEPAR